jgi:hypothetical protein
MHSSALMKHFLRFAILSTFITITPLNALAYNAKAQANAAITIIAACKWSQMGKIPRSRIMSFAQQQYAAQYGSSSGIDWNNAISIAQKLDKKEGIGCFK